MQYLLMVLGWASKGYGWAVSAYHWVASFFFKHKTAFDTILEILHNSTLSNMDKAKAIASIIFLEISKMVSSNEIETETRMAVAPSLEEIHEKVQKILDDPSKSEDEKAKELKEMLG